MRWTLQSALGALVVAMIGSTAHAQSDIGLRLVAQPWTPTTDDDLLHEVLADGSLISRSVRESLARAKPELERSVTEALTQPDMLAGGVTLYSVAVTASEPSFAITSTQGGGDTPATFATTLTYNELHIDTRSTTPGPLPSSVDPHCEIRLGLAFDLPMRIGSDPTRPFESAIEPDARTARITYVNINSLNTSCDILREFGVTDVLEGMVARNPQIATQLEQAVEPQVEDALAAMNDALNPHVPVGSIMRSWASATQITLAYAPPARADDGARARVSGSFTSTTGDGNGTREVHCQDLEFRAAMKLGPAKLLLPNGELGEAPFAPLTLTLRCDRQGRYTLDGVAAHFPNYFQSMSWISGSCPPGGAGMYSKKRVTGMTDEYGRVLPPEVGVEHDLVAELYEKFCGSGTPIPGGSQPPNDDDDVPIGILRPGDASPPIEFPIPGIEPIGPDGPIIDGPIIVGPVIVGPVIRRQIAPLKPQPLPPAPNLQR